MPPEVPNGQEGERRRVRADGEQEGRKIQRHRGVVGPHPDAQQRIREEVAKALGGGHQPGDAPRQAKGHRRGEGPDEQAEIELHRAHRHAPRRPAEEPPRQLRRQRPGQARQLSAQHEEDPDPHLGQEGDRRGPDQFGQAQVQPGHGRGEEAVPVVVRVLQPPLPCAKHPQQSGEKEHGGKQRVLAPQAVPGVVQNLDVPQVVHGPQDGREDRQQHEGQPDRRAAALLQFRFQTAQQHPSHLLPDEQRPSHGEKQRRPAEQQRHVPGLRPAPEELRELGFRVPIHPGQGQQAVVPPGDEPHQPIREQHGQGAEEAAGDPAHQGGRLVGKPQGQPLLQGEDHHADRPGDNGEEGEPPPGDLPGEMGRRAHGRKRRGADRQQRRQHQRAPDQLCAVQPPRRRQGLQQLQRGPLVLQLTVPAGDDRHADGQEDGVDEGQIIEEQHPPLRQIPGVLPGEVRTEPQ